MPATAPSQAVLRRSSWIPAFCAAAAIGATFVALVGYSVGATPEERWLLAARYTARLSFPIFVLVFVASSWNRLAPSRVSRFLVQRRRALGLAFATAHTIHLAALVTRNVVAGERPGAVTLLAGGSAYLVMFAMALSSNDSAVRLLGRNWLRLHKVGIYWLWFVFTVSYAKRTFGALPEFAPLFGLAVAALALRIAASRARRPQRVGATSLASAEG